MDCLRMVGMDHLAEQRADRLSGGQSQRVAVARALMARPQIVFADEPVASLDPHVGEEVMALFAALGSVQGITLVFTTHNLDHALKYSTRIIGLQSGRVRIDAPTRSLSKADLDVLYA